MIYPFLWTVSHLNTCLKFGVHFTLLKDLRTLRIAVFHPDDADGRQLIQQLQRIGCQVQAFWPALPAGIDVVFLAVRPESMDAEFQWLRGEEVPTIIAMVTYENPTIVEAVLRIGVQAVLPSPIRSFGLLSALEGCALRPSEHDNSSAAHAQA
jgi:AmiR/NasT family two-component response regulator